MVRTRKHGDPMRTIEPTLEERRNRVGERKEVTFFAFLPYTIGRETRWMETITIIQGRIEAVVYGG